MARKYMTVEFIDDEFKIKSIIKECRPNIKFVKFSYIRDDRVVSLSTNTVYINEAPGSEYKNTENVYSRTGEIDLAYDKIANAKLIDGKLVGERVKCRLGDNDKIQFEIEEHTIVDFNKGRINLHYTTISEIIDLCNATSGLEYVSEGLSTILQYYNQDERSPNWLMKLWWLVDYYNLYDSLNEYSHLLSYHEEISLDDSQADFFAAAHFVPDFIFRCSNYYLAETRASGNSWNSKLNALKTTSTLFEFYNSLSENCKKAFIEGAKNERYDLMALNEISYMKQDIIKYANDSPAFFCDYILKAKTHENHENILSSFRRDYVELLSYEMPLKYESLKKLQFNQKARALNCSLNELFNIIDRLDTKEGIIEYLTKSEIG